MAISFSCINCAKKYKVDDSLAGKTAKCQGCGQPIKIPQPTMPEVASAKPTKVVDTSVPEAKEFGLTGIQREDDFFAGADQPTRGNPLGEYVQDYGIAAQPVVEEKKTDGDLDIPQFGENPAVAEVRHMQMESARREGKMMGAPPAGEAKQGPPPSAGPAGTAQRGQTPAKKKGLFSSPAMITALILFPIQILLGIVGLVLAGMGSSVGPVIPIIGLGIAGLLNVGSQLWALVRVFQNSSENIVEALLYLFVPFYAFYYWIKYWEVMKQPVLMIIIAAVGTFLGIIEMVVAGLLVS